MLADQLIHLIDLFHEGYLYALTVETTQLILMLVYENFWTLLALSIVSFVVSKLTQKYQNKRIKLYFIPDSQVFSEMLKETELSKMVSYLRS